MQNLTELLAVLATFVGASFTLVRMTLAQQQRSTERFVAFLEASLVRQEATIGSFRGSLDNLSEAIAEHNALLRRVTETAGGRS